MGDLNVRLKDGVTGTEVQAELPDDCSVRELLPAIVEQLSITQVDNLKLQNKSQGFEYGEEDTLSSRGTKANDTCLLTYEPEQG